MDSLNRLRNRRPIFTHNNQNYAIMHCTGYVKNTPPLGVSIDAINSNGTPNCLVAIARLQIANMPIVNEGNLGQTASQFTMRIAEDGKITFVDQRIVELIGLTPSNLLNRYCWEVVHPADENLLKNTFTQLINSDQMIKVCFKLFYSFIFFEGFIFKL